MVFEKRGFFQNDFFLRLPVTGYPPASAKEIGPHPRPAKSLKRPRFRSPPENKRKARLIQHNLYYVE